MDYYQHIQEKNMNTAKMVWHVVKTDHELHWIIAGMLFMLVSLLAVIFENSIGLNTNITGVITNGLLGIGYLIWFFATEKSKFCKYCFLFMFGFFSVTSIYDFVALLGYNW